LIHFYKRMLIPLVLLVAGASASPLHYIPSVIPYYSYFFPQQYIGLPLDWGPETAAVVLEDPEDIDFDCPLGPDGNLVEDIYPNPDNCTSYYACNIKPCDDPTNPDCVGNMMLVPSKGYCNSLPGLAYNPETKDCDIATNLGCDLFTGRDANPKPEAVRVEPDEECAGLIANNITTTAYVYDEEQDDCVAYFRCVGDGRAISFECAPGTIFNGTGPVVDGAPCVTGDSTSCSPLQ